MAGEQFTEAERKLLEDLDTIRLECCSNVHVGSGPDATFAIRCRHCGANALSCTTCAAVLAQSPHAQASCAVCKVRGCMHDVFHLVRLEARS